MDTAEVYWHKISFLNTAEDYEQFILHYYFNWKDIVIYQYDGTTLEAINQSGYSYTKKKHEYLHAQYHSTLNLNLKTNKPSHFLVRLELDKDYVGHPRILAPTIWEKNDYVKNESNYRGIAYFLLGICTIMFFYNLVLFFGTKDKNYLYYLLVLTLLCQIKILFGFEPISLKSFP